MTGVGTKLLQQAEQLPLDNRKKLLEVLRDRLPIARRIVPTVPLWALEEADNPFYVELRKAIAGDMDAAGFTYATMVQLILDQIAEIEGNPANYTKNWARRIDDTQRMVIDPVRAYGGLVIGGGGDQVQFAYDPDNAYGFAHAMGEICRRIRRMEPAPGPKGKIPLGGRLGADLNELLLMVPGDDEVGRVAWAGGPALKIGEKLESAADSGSMLVTESLAELLQEKGIKVAYSKHVDGHPAFVIEDLPHEIPERQEDALEKLLARPINENETYDIASEIRRIGRLITYAESFHSPAIVEQLFKVDENGNHIGYIPAWQPAAIGFVFSPRQKAVIDFARETKELELGRAFVDAQFRVIKRALGDSGRYLKGGEGKDLVMFGSPNPTPNARALTGEFNERLEDHKSDEKIREVVSELPRKLQQEIEELPLVVGWAIGEPSFQGHLGFAPDVLGHPVNMAARIGVKLLEARPKGNVQAYCVLPKGMSANDTIPFSPKGADPVTLVSMKELMKKDSMHTTFRRKRTLVGRVEKIDRLEHAYLASKNDEKAHFISIQGEAGSGKTALVGELERRINDNFYIAETAEHAGAPYALVKSLIRNWLCLRPSTSKVELEVAFDKINDEHQPVVNYLLSLGLTKEAPKATSPEEFEDLVMDVVNSMLGDEYSVVILENMHRADEQSLNVLSRLAEQAKNKLFVTTLTGTPDEKLNKLVRERIEISDFDKAEAAAFAESIIGVLPETTFDFVWGRSQGNPYRIEATLEHLRDQGLLDDKGVLTTDPGDIHIPDIDQLVLGRLSHESDINRATLGYMSAWHEERVPLNILPKLAGRDEHELKRIISGLTDSRWIFTDGEFVWFRHNSEKRAVHKAFDRSQEHERILDELAPSKDHPLLAHHADRTRNEYKEITFISDAASELPNGALHPLISDFEAALRFAERGLTRPYNATWDDELKAKYLQLMLRKAVPLANLGRVDEAEALYAEILQTMEDPIHGIQDEKLREQRLWITEFNIAQTLTEFGRKEDAKPHWKHCEEVGSTHWDDKFRAQVYLRMAQAYDGEEKATRIESAVAYARSDAGNSATPVLSSSLSNLIAAYIDAEQIAKAEEVLPEALDIAESLDHTSTLGEIFKSKAKIARSKGDVIAATELYKQSESHYEQTGNIRQKIVIAEELADFYAEQNTAQALAYVERIRDYCSQSIRLEEAWAERIQKLEEKINQQPAA